MPEDNIVTEDQINIKMANNNEEQTSLFKKQEEIKEDKSKEILTLEHALTVEDENYEFPPVEFLSLLLVFLELVLQFLLFLLQG